MLESGLMNCEINETTAFATLVHTGTYVMKIQIFAC